MKTLLKYLLLAALMTANVQLFAQAADPAARDALAPSQPPKVEKVADGVIVPLQGAFLKVEFCAPDIVRVVCAPNRAFFDHKSVTLGPEPAAKTSFSVKTQNSETILSSSKLQVHVNLLNGAISFFDSAGKPILAETAGGRSIASAAVQGEQTFHVRQQWEPNADESLYGLGQRQIGIVDIKGYDLDLWQHNTHVVVPLLVSSRGYGVFWDNLSYTRFGDLRTFEPIPANCLVDVSNQPGGLTTGTFTQANPDSLANAHATSTIGLPPRSRGGGGGGGGGWMRWVGELVPPTTGDYQIKTYSNGHIKMWLDGKVVIDHWRQGWLTDNDQIKVRLEAGHHYPIKVESGGDQRSTMELTWKTPDPNGNTSLWSEVGDGVDYYFIYGPSLDHVVAGYRQLTGQASLMPEWAFGLWQSRQRYETDKQSLDVVKEFRQRAIPFDDIVQDWQYWPRDAWGSHEFDLKRFPDPAAWIKSLHDLHAHVMISVWGKFYPGSTNFNAMQKAGFLYQPNITEGMKDWINYPYTFYDAFNPGARKLYWSQINSALFSKGIDAWWEDATEPDLTPSPPTLEGQRVHMNPTAMGTASRVMNGYALMNSKGMYEGQRSVAPNQRVFILTRSGFAGIQRYGTATWSGDTTGTWTAMKKQSAAVFGFSISVTPYWTMDIGGYTMESRFSTGNPTPENADEWRELNARWFEFGAFCPLTRLHGELIPREPWAFGGDSAPAYQAIVKFDKIRYRLLPYIYSLAGEITQDAGTMMRPLVMDFQNDAGSRGIADEYIFGPAFLVAPVTTYQARSRSVYLPPTDGDWYDFWTGASVAGGRTFDAAAPYDAMPLFVRAGSIIPNGPDIQYTGEKPADPITLFIYTGANGAFTLYEDDGLTYNYEHGDFARIPITWDNATQTLAIGKREGKFTGMLAKHTFNIVLVNKNKPVGFSFTPTADQTVTYTGSALKVTLK